jgi:hypothetical protein
VCAVSCSGVFLCVQVPLGVPAVIHFTSCWLVRIIVVVSIACDRLPATEACRDLVLIACRNSAIVVILTES